MTPGYDESATARWVAEPPKRAGRSDFERARTDAARRRAVDQIASLTIPG
jgi:dGTPase